MTGVLIVLDILATVGLLIFLTRRSKADAQGPTPDGEGMDAATPVIAYLAAHHGLGHHGGEIDTGDGGHDGGVGHV